MKGITRKQHEILRFIETFIQHHQYSPSYREIMEHFDFSSPGTVSKHLQTLKRKGLISSDKQSHRSIFPIQPSERLPESPDCQLPLIGNLILGYPLELFARPQLIAVPPSMVPHPNHTYLLQVHGSSLHEEGILDDDLLLIEARQEIEPGEIILGLINQRDPVLKRYYPEGQNVRLENLQAEASPLILHAEHVAIQGVMTSLFRIY